MEEIIKIQGRTLTTTDIQSIQVITAENPSWNRTQLSREICRIWDWRNGKGRLKDMACRSMFIKLEASGYVTLPPRVRSATNTRRNRVVVPVEHSVAPIYSELAAITPVEVALVQGKAETDLFKTFLSCYHYLGYSGTVGENLKYLIYDRRNRPLACLLFGSAAWKVKARDSFIGWTTAFREKHLHLLTNNMRFLILPWVRVPNLASHILGLITQRISGDWEERYGHSIFLLETFVERDRFRGTCYKAANWMVVGQTRGRTRNDRYQRIRVPVKAIYLYPLRPDFQERLNGE